MSSFLSFLIRVASWKAPHVRGLYSVAEAWPNSDTCFGTRNLLDPLTRGIKRAIDLFRLSILFSQ